MSRKAFEVKVELDIQAITCPGVWLCPSGKVSVQLYILGSCIQTTSLQPVFPLLCHETFIFYKTFHTAHRLSELQKVLNKECMYAELIQWQNCEVGNVLASFKTSLSELLYPSIKEGVVPGIDIDLLMEPAKSFPGIISPKMEVSTRTTIEEKLCVSDLQNCEPYVVNPKLLSSKCYYRPTLYRQKKVCHSAGYHISRTRIEEKKEKKEAFKYRKPQEGLIGRKPQGLTIHDRYCNCKSSAKHQNDAEVWNTQLSSGFADKNPWEVNAKWARKVNKKNAGAVCNHGEVHGDCPICAKYKYYFEDPSPSVSPNFTARAYRMVGNTSARNKCSVHPQKICVCPVSNESADKSTREVRRCDCNRSNLDEKFEKKVCACPPTKKPSLAEKLHDRLSRTLKCPDCPLPEKKTAHVRNYRTQSPVCQSSCSPMQCQLNEDELSQKCTDWYGNFDRFYKQFYKDRSGCNKYIAC